MCNSTFFPSSSPYREPITELLQLLINAQIIPPNNKQQAIAIAQDYLENHSDFINITWSADDVLEVADERGLKLSQEQALEVLDSLEDNHDACYGINWDTIYYTLDSFDSN